MAVMCSNKTRLPLATILLSSFAAHQIPALALTSMSMSMTNMSMSNNKPSSTDKKIKVGIIGGGIAGLSCAAHISKSPNSHLFETTVFDTGRLRPGGRCSSRYPGDRIDSKNKNKGTSKDQILSRFVVDHAAQILTVPGSFSGADEFGEFRKQVEEWETQGVLKKFPPNSVIDILNANNNKRGNNTNNDNKKDNDNTGQPLKVKVLNNNGGKGKGFNPTMYYGADGMGSIPAAIANVDQDASSFQIEQDVWISPSNGVKFIGSATNAPKWTIQTNGKRFGSYDKIVIAHNGKCADRLMSRTPAKSLHSLLRTNFAPSVPAWGGKRMTLNSIYSLTIAIKKDSSPLSKALGEDVISAFVKNEPSLRFLTCQSRKHDNTNSDVEVWTILSSATFAKKFKAPQENIPKERVEEVTNLMLSGLERSLHMKEGAIPSKLILDSRLQLWGAAVPMNTWSSSSSDDDDKNKEKVVENNGSTGGFLYDAEHGVGACGDWLLDPSIGGAWESGRRLSQWIVEQSDVHEASSSVGLEGAFRISNAAKAAGIGSIR